MQPLRKREPVGLLIGTARRKLKQAVAARVRPYRLSVQQFWVLVAVAERHGASQSELAERLRLDAPTASRTIASLAARGLVRSASDPADRRRSRMELSAKGEALAGRVLPLAHEARAAVVAGLTQAEQETLRHLLRKVIANVTRFEARVEEGTE
jgi:DNA-binding MarR family transcriptional regulator